MRILRDYGDKTDDISILVLYINLELSSLLIIHLFLLLFLLFSIFMSNLLFFFFLFRELLDHRCTHPFLTTMKHVHKTLWSISAGT